MHPALSIIVFSTLSGAGLGLGFWFGLLSAGTGGIPAAICAGTTIVITTIGLCCSVFHLRRPSRAWRALSQWRSSWLSREGILAPAALGLVFAQWAALWLGSASGVWLGAAASILCVSAVYATSMIYAQIKAVPAWSTPLTPLMFLSFAAAGGSTIACAMPGVPAFGSLGFASVSVACNFAAWAVAWLWWQRLDKIGFGPSSTASATGLTDRGEVRLLEPPHTGSNYLLDEMGYVVARRHAYKLRRLSMLCGGAVVVLLIVSGIAVDNVPLFASIAIMFHLVGAGVARWLFFAESRHLVTLYY